MRKKTRTLAAWKEFQRLEQPKNDALFFALLDWESDLLAIQKVVTDSFVCFQTRKTRRRGKSKAQLQVGRNPVESTDAIN